MNISSKAITHITFNPWAMAYSPLVNFATVAKHKGFKNILYRLEYQLEQAQKIESSLEAGLFDETIQLRPKRRWARLLKGLVRLAVISENDSVGLAFALGNKFNVVGDYLIGYDGIGASMAWAATRLSRKPYAIFSLELEERPNPTAFEKQAWRNAQYVITFDSTRAEILQSQYGLKSDKLVTIANCGIGLPYVDRSDFLRSRLGIPPNKSIVLMVGSLIDEHCVRDVISAAKSWTPNFTLVLHGWGLSDENKAYFNEIKQLLPERIFLSTDLVPRDKRYELFASADIGIVSFTDRTINHRFAGASAGKLFDFCQAGVPVIASELPGMRQLVEENKIGFVVKDFSSCHTEMQELTNRRDVFIQSCHHFFEANEFSKQMDVVITALKLDDL